MFFNKSISEFSRGDILSHPDPQLYCHALTASSSNSVKTPDLSADASSPTLESAGVRLLPFFHPPCKQTGGQKAGEEGSVAIEDILLCF